MRGQACDGNVWRDDKFFGRVEDRNQKEKQKKEKLKTEIHLRKQTKPRKSTLRVRINNREMASTTIAIVRNTFQMKSKSSRR